MNSFEKGRRRVPVSLLPVIALTLQTTLFRVGRARGVAGDGRTEEARTAEEDSTAAATD